MAYVNGFKVYDENNANTISDSAYELDTQRLNGASAGQVISSSLTNTTLRMLSVRANSLLDALIQNSATGSGTLNMATSPNDLTSAIVTMLGQLTVKKATNSTNASIVRTSETLTTARQTVVGAGIYHVRTNVSIGGTTHVLDLGTVTCDGAGSVGEGPLTYLYTDSNSTTFYYQARIVNENIADHERQVLTIVQITERGTVWTTTELGGLGFWYVKLATFY